MHALSSTLRHGIVPQLFFSFGGGFDLVLIGGSRRYGANEDTNVLLISKVYISSSDRNEGWGLTWVTVISLQRHLAYHV